MNAIQVVFSNGVASPVFASRGVDSTNLISVNLNSQQIKKIRGGEYATHGISLIFFQDKEGKELASIKTWDITFAPDQLLNDDEEILGIYGSKDVSAGDNRFASIGFIVWKPPKF